MCDCSRPTMLPVAASRNEPSGSRDSKYCRPVETSGGRFCAGSRSWLCLKCFRTRSSSSPSPTPARSRTIGHGGFHNGRMLNWGNQGSGARISDLSGRAVGVVGNVRSAKSEIRTLDPGLCHGLKKETRCHGGCGSRCWVVSITSRIAVSIVWTSFAMTPIVTSGGDCWIGRPHAVAGGCLLTS